MHRFRFTISYMLIPYAFLLVVLFPSQGWSFSIIDDEQQTTQFTKPFSRIISLYPAHTENLAYLGCEEQLIGIGKSDNFPEHITSKQRFSYRDNSEKFLAASPDLILIRPMISRSQPELMKKLKSSGITIISLQPTSIDAMFTYWQQLGTLCGKQETAEQMVHLFQDSIQKMTSTLPEDDSQWPGVYFESIHSKMKTFAPDSISAFTLYASGGRNVAIDAKGRNQSNIAPYGKERILALASSIDVFLSQVGRMNRITLDEIYAEPGFKLIKAVQNNAVFLVEEELVSRPTMRLLDGVKKIQSLLYDLPEQISKSSQITSYLHNPQHIQQ